MSQKQWNGLIWRCLTDQATSWCLNANVISYEPRWKRCNQPFLIQLCLRGWQPSSLSYCLCNTPKLPLTAAKSRTFHLQASSGLCYSSHFYFLQKCHHFINLARHEIREAVHESCLPTERTEPCMSSPLHTVHNPSNMQNGPFVF